MSERHSEYDINSLFIERWSPRVFDDEFMIEEEDLKLLFEAARWSPSCFNEQPWRFYYVMKQHQGFNDKIEWLVEGNQKWARSASALIFLVAKKSFAKNGKKNDYSWFDSGAAWMSLTLQARMGDLYTHGMGGVHKDKVFDGLKLTDDDDVVCAIAVGKKKKLELLTESERESEKLSDRVSVENFCFAIEED